MSDLQDRNSFAPPPTFALPGVPLKSELEAEAAAEQPPTAPAAPAARTAEPENKVPEKPIPVTAPPAGGLDSHLAAAQKYSARKKYIAAAAEYRAAMRGLPASDARAVHMLERQGAMHLRNGNNPRAKEFFLSAIEKAKELGTSGDDLANAYLGLGYCQELDEKFPDAIKNYEKVLEFSSSKLIKARVAQTIEDLKKK